jgi:hypothetical protein
MAPYFWLIFGIVNGVIGGLVIRYVLLKQVANGKLNANEVNSFSRNFILLIFLSSMAFWILQLSIGPDAPFEFFKWSGPQLILAWSVQLIIYLVILYWILISNGATKLSRFTRAIGKESLLNSPTAFKVLAIVMVSPGLLMLVTGNLPNYAIKGTSVETLDSSELSSGASVPYFGC